MKKNLAEEEKAWAEDMQQTEGKVQKAEKPHKYEQIVTVSFNKKFNGIELSFRTKPNATERAKLKRAGYKWHYKKCIWYATNTPERLAAINTLCGTIKYPDGYTPAAEEQKHDEQRDEIRDELKQFMQDNATHILIEAAHRYPDFMIMDIDAQNRAYTETAAALMDQAAVA